MRTTLDLPDGLVEEARAAIGFKSKTDTVVYALREIVRRSRKEDLKALIRRVDFGARPGALRQRDRARVRP
jgi:hypothetical protein